MGLGGLGDIADKNADTDSEPREQRNAYCYRPRGAFEVSCEGNDKPDRRDSEQRPPTPNHQAKDETACNEGRCNDDRGMVPRLRGGRNGSR